ncbi:MAG: tail fiber domain-containing protein [Candidatus Omnitrophota bacterium]
MEGNVGIGTVNPGVKLHIIDDQDGAFGNGVSIMVENLDSGNNGGVSAVRFMRAGSTRWALINDIDGNKTDDLTIWGGGAVKAMTVKATSGNVGIGTTSPEANLHVSGSGALTQDLLLVRGGGGSGNYKSLSVKSNSGDDLFYVNALSYNVIMGTSGTGYLGIGTASPRAPLEIQGTAGSWGKLAVGGTTHNIHFFYGANEDVYIRSGTTSGGVYIQDDSAGNTYINPSGGSLGIGTNSFLGGKFEVAGTSILEWLQHTGGSTSNYYTIYSVGGTVLGSVTSDGGWTRINFNTSSDRRLKENIIPTSRGLKVLMSIPVRDFNFIADPGKKKVQGFIAQELYEVYPEAVKIGGKDLKTEPWMVDYARLTPLLVKSVQELKGENDSIKSELCRKDPGYSWCRR